MFNRKIIKKEISLLNFLLTTTGKLLIGVGVGIVIATHYYIVQPLWYILIVLGALILYFALKALLKAEEKEEKSLEKKLKR